MEYINIFYSVYLHIFLLFCFLTIFFWLVISKTEKKSLNNEINSGIKNNLKNITVSNKLFTDEEVHYFEKYYKDQDLNVSRNNKNLLQFNIAFIVFLLIIINTLNNLWRDLDKVIRFGSAASDEN